MPEDFKQQKTISKKNTGFQEYLDFDTLRREGIGYLGKLSGKLWTDHNVHDPGITLLEMLCYALLDLGYRTNLPAADIFTKNPDEPFVENNFYTPAQILTNNPLTIIDFRKLLIDIPGIKNAWLEIATDFNVEKFCNTNTDPASPALNNALADDPCCDKYLNGLYHVYIDLDKNITATKEIQFVKDKAIEALLAHRNFCEDFIDINILCKLQLGVCADIELETEADTEQVYLEIANALQQFFSPAPLFYTLPQLLDKGKTIEEIFAGRPIDITESHGFVDTAELEQITLRKEIHLSDVYNILLSIKGVRRVQQLRLKKCAGGLPSENWKFKIPKNYVVEFSITCSGFKFSRQGVPVVFDTTTFNTLVEIAAQQNGKILYNKMFPALDYAIPQGIFRTDLDKYYSIQNEFPRVYGIADGGLPDNVTDARKAQALQLKGYLLFFDQMLASYLSQLKNIPSLFAFSTSADQQNQHTYFVNNDLASVPDLQKLLRLASNQSHADKAMQGSTLTIPVDKKILLQLIDTGQIKNTAIENIGLYKFKNLEATNIAVAQLMDDIYNNNFEYGIVEKNDACVFYYLLSSSDCIALISNHYFSSQTEAKFAVESLTYTATFAENYRTWFDEINNFAAFNIEFNLADYSKYLQLLTEDKVLYQQRRQSFLNHLLARFAEQFSDYALLSYNNYLQVDVDVDEVKAKENFLSNYPQLSSNRGKGYNYKLNGWNNDNVAGFEKRVKAYSGIKNWKRHSLCNFEVAEYENKYIFNVRLGDKVVFKTAEIFNSKADARKAVAMLLHQLKNKAAFNTNFIAAEQSHSIEINYQQKQPAVFTTRFATIEEAKTTKANLQQFFSGGFAENDIFINSYLYNARLLDNRGELIKTFNDSVDSMAASKLLATKNISKINTTQLWKDVGEKKLTIGKLIFDNTKEEPTIIDTGNFKVISNNAIVGSPDKYTYSLLDSNNTFKLFSVNEFTEEKLAKQDSEKLLLLMTDAANYATPKNKEGGKYNIVIKEGKNIAAISEISFESEQAAKTAKASVIEIVDKNCYRLAIHQFAATWKFNYPIGYNVGEQYIFESSTSFKSIAEAKKAGQQFAESIAETEVNLSDGFIELSSLKNKKNGIAVRLVNENKKISLAKKTQTQHIEKLLAAQKESIALLQQKNDQALDKFIEIDEASRAGLFVYRLVDKDNLYAFYKLATTDKSPIETALPNIISFDKKLYNYLDLCLKGDIINKRKDEKDNSYWYHYQIKSSNSIYKPAPAELKALVLFESTNGYESSEEAMKAFEENYMEIMRLAALTDNYGVAKKISTTELLIHSNDACVNTISIVFVPKATLDYLGDETKAIAALIKVVKSYPIKSIFPKSDCKDFFTRFKNCEEGDCAKEEKVDCTNNKIEKAVYYFSLFDKQQDSEEWQSVTYYETVAEAWKHFEFFFLLLSYPGNYFIDSSCKSSWNETLKIFESSPVYKIFIREVLAESADRFASEEEAWGAKGLQKFIDVSQSVGSFHTYLNKKKCCNSFYIACANTKLYHPCTYNTPAQRDKAATLLFTALEKIKSWHWDGYCEEGIREFIIKDFEGNNIATVNTNEQTEVTNYFEWYATILNCIALYGLCIEDNQLYLRGKSLSFQPIITDITAEALKEKLLWLAAYFPFTQKRLDNAFTKYCIEIKMPGLDTDNTDDCSNETGEGICYTAWKGDCCYATCADAVEAYKTGLLLLSNFDNYKSVYDCACNAYGIALHYVNTFSINENNECGYLTDQQQRILLPCDNAIVAYNPQCYLDAKTACEAVGRANALINAAGLHVAEHILLRPQCVEECTCKLSVCQNEFADCTFPNWQKPTEDYCKKEQAVCFVPGYDPYSFIATVVLPAWPLQFRNKQNRLVLQNILYREAPAHVLLRTLWLAPHDFCCFEKNYKQWQAWLGKKKQFNNFTVCTLNEFLFNRQYQPLAEPTQCLPCNDNQQQPDPCAMQRMQQAAIEDVEGDWLNKINEVFCWQEQNPTDYNFISCKDETIVDIIIEAPVVVNEKIGIEKLGKAKFIRSRFANYSKIVDELVKQTKGLKIVAIARRFIDINAPSPEEYKSLMEEIIKAAADKKNKVLNKKNVATLISSVTRFFIDKWAFNGKKISVLQKSADVFTVLQKNKIDMLDIYRLWESDALKKQEPDIDMNTIKYLLTGNK